MSRQNVHHGICPDPQTEIAVFALLLLLLLLLLPCHRHTQQSKHVSLKLRPYFRNPDALNPDTLDSIRV